MKHHQSRHSSPPAPGQARLGLFDDSAKEQFAIAAAWAHRAAAARDPRDEKECGLATLAAFIAALSTPLPRGPHGTH